MRCRQRNQAAQASSNAATLRYFPREVIGFMSRIVSIRDTFSKSVSLPAEDSKQFRALVGDLHALHTDEASAKHHHLGSLIASGVQPTATFIALMSTHFSAFGQPRLLELDLKLAIPVHPGDSITMTWTVVDAFWKASMNGDLVVLDGTVVNQRSKEVMSAKAKVLVMPKPQKTAEA